MKSQTLEFGENDENKNHNKESRRNRTSNENRHSIKPEISSTRNGFDFRISFPKERESNNGSRKTEKQSEREKNR
jgi:hypothetical protein